MSSLKDYDLGYWEDRWRQSETGWDIGHVSTPIKEYFDQFTNKDANILIPGCGNAWEGEYLIDQGFKNVELIDIAPSAVETFKSRVAHFPTNQVLQGDFFELNKTYDVIVEQTFFCALDPSLRTRYAEKTHDLLKSGGSLVGLLFNKDFGFDHPPFGGTREEYLSYFEPLFDIKVMEESTNSISPRRGAELFIHLKKR